MNEWLAQALFDLKLLTAYMIIVAMLLTTAALIANIVDWVQEAWQNRNYKKWTRQTKTVWHNPQKEG